MKNRIFNILVDDLLLIGNLVFGAFAAIFWTIYLVYDNSLILYPLILNGIQIIFLISQLVYNKLTSNILNKK